MIIVSKPPLRTKPVGTTLFAAGSIEMGKAEDWQSLLPKRLKKSKVGEIPITIFNPRRDNWNIKWKQSIYNRQFANQVHWELDHIYESDVVAFYFCAGTLSPISLMELGICSQSKPDKTIVCAPKGFWRRGNIEVVCNRSHIKLVESIDSLIENVVEKIHVLNKK